MLLLTTALFTIFLNATSLNGSWVAEPGSDANARQKPSEAVNEICQVSHALEGGKIRATS